MISAVQGVLLFLSLVFLVGNVLFRWGFYARGRRDAARDWEKRLAAVRTAHAESLAARDEIIKLRGEQATKLNMYVRQLEADNARLASGYATALRLIHGSTSDRRPN